MKTIDRPARLGRGLAALRLMNRVYRYIVPDVRHQLEGWRKKAAAIPDPELRRQAMASLTTKQFHCEGGAVFAALNLSCRHVLIPLIVAFQTISDYLDNLCDRSTSLNAQDFRLLHRSMLDAVNPSASLRDYYAEREEKEDGGYLDQLVRTCQSCILLLPSYGIVQPYIEPLVALYCDLQVYKHIAVEKREEALLSWWELHREQFPQLMWNEFAAASGSTLGVFMLFLAAADTNLTKAQALQIRDGYFPYVCGLHILLDYLIDLREDRLGGDLNFCSYFQDEPQLLERFRYIISGARSKARQMPEPRFQRLLIEGLLALYLSDPKASEQDDVRRVARRLLKGSPISRIFFFFNIKWIRKRMYRWQAAKSGE